MRAVQIKSSEAADLSTKPGRQQRQGQQQHMRQGCQVPWPSKSISNRAQHSKQSQYCLHASTVDAGQSLLMNCAQAPAPLQLIDLAAPESYVCVSGAKVNCMQDSTLAQETPPCCHPAILRLC
jgi:hypothetical protein